MPSTRTCRLYSNDPAEDGESALENIGRTHFDVVLLDIIMPGLDGVVTLQKIKELDPNLPVIMISALDETDSVRRCLQLGAEDYLRKFFDPVLLRSGLAATLIAAVCVTPNASTPPRWKRR